MKRPKILAAGIALWAAAAVTAGAFRAMAYLSPPLTGGIFAALMAIAYTGAYWAGLARPALPASTLRRLVALHLVRFIGVAFLWYEAQGRLPTQFAERAGWGDIAAAAGAGILLLLPDGALFRSGLFVWSVAGVADLAVAVGTAVWLSITRPGAMDEIARLPLTLIPLFAVPLLFATHAIILRGMWRASADPAPGRPYCTS